MNRVEMADCVEQHAMSNTGATSGNQISLPGTGSGDSGNTGGCSAEIAAQCKASFPEQMSGAKPCNDLSGTVGETPAETACGMKFMSSMPRRPNCPCKDKDDDNSGGGDDAQVQGWTDGSTVGGEEDNNEPIDVDNDMDNDAYPASKDCYDDNFSAHPGQTSWFRVHRGDGSWDYDCDGQESKRWTSMAGSCSYNPKTGKCAGVKDGWASNTPTCGKSAFWNSDCQLKTLTSWQKLANPNAEPTCTFNNGAGRTQECH